jgi:hypothetical protein
MRGDQEPLLPPDQIDERSPIDGHAASQHNEVAYARDFRGRKALNLDIIAARGKKDAAHEKRMKHGKKNAGFSCRESFSFLRGPI